MHLLSAAEYSSKYALLYVLLDLAKDLLTSLQAERDPDEEGDYFAFEQLMAEGVAKKEKTEKKKEGKKAKVDISPEAAPS